MDDVLDYQDKPAGMPAFLKVLCILTFVGAGLYALIAIFNMINFQSSIAQLEASGEILSSANSPFGDMSGLIAATKKWGMVSYALGLVGSLLCLTGALLMWKLKKIGFYIYVVGQIIPFIGSFLMMGAASGSGDFMGTMATISLVFSIIFSVAFIVMYAFNLKHLK
ncbi:MAG: hypothetical protein K0R65_642 [Crocinitomicaceae bacterium]|jgi:hypothetical protein|nr:hypothetical protein [Crocinitomicaceae bacterium]